MVARMEQLLLEPKQSVVSTSGPNSLGTYGNHRYTLHDVYHEEQRPPSVDHEVFKSTSGATMRAVRALAKNRRPTGLAAQPTAAKQSGAGGGGKPPLEVLRPRRSFRETLKSRWR